MINTKVEQYLIKKKLGNGAMGSVYLALDTNLDRPAALKFILSDFDDHPEMAKRFLAEAKVLASLNRPNIPILYSYFMWEGKGVMAMEYVDGETLEGMVRQRGPIPANVSVPLVKQALQGLAAAHRLGIVHRDLKPGNIMVNQEGTVKVVDFGIAKKIEGEAGLTGTNTTLGTPWYMAPEQIMGKPITPRTDIYSIGVVLYELLAGQVPFNADSIYEIQTAHVQKVPDPPTIHYPHIPHDIVDAVMKALQKDPEKRFATAEEFARALPDSQPTAVAMQTADFVPEVAKHRPVGAISQQDYYPPAPINEFAATAGTEILSKIAADSPASPPGRSRGKLIGAIVCGVIAVVGGVTWWGLRPEPAKRSDRGVPGTLVQPATTGANPIPVPSHDPDDIPPSSPSHEGTHPSPPALPTHVTTKTGKAVTAPKESPTHGSSTAATTHQVAAGQELSGLWQGSYTDAASPEKNTRVRLEIREEDGSSVNGTLTFQKADNSTGSCGLNGSTYRAETKQLQLLVHCSSTAPGSVPGYFHSTTNISVPDLSDRSLSGKIFSFPTVTVALQRR